MPELPREAGLQLRMLLALGIALLILAAAALLLVLLVVAVEDGLYIAGMLLVTPVMFAVMGLIGGRDSWASWRSREPAEADEARVEQALSRLAQLAGARQPGVKLVTNRTPLSWTTSLPWRPATIHVSTGMLDRLEDRELNAVLAHELSHLLHRDAELMTMLAGPPTLALRGMRAMIDEDLFQGLLAVVVIGPFVAVPAALMLALARIVSRARELAADRAAAVLTGSPAAVASALLAVQEGLQGLPSIDLRRAAALDAFHFVPTRPARALLRPWATHPSTDARVERMQRFEAAIQR